MARATKIVKSSSVGGPESLKLSVGKAEVCGQSYGTGDMILSSPHLLEPNMYLISNNFQLGIRTKCVIKGL